MFEKHRPNEKVTINKIVLCLISQLYRQIWLKLVHWLSRYRILEKMYVWFYIVSIYCNKYDSSIDSEQQTDNQYYKKILQQHRLIFWLYVWIPIFVGIDSLHENLRYINSPFSWHQHSSVVYFKWGYIFC